MDNIDYKILIKLMQHARTTWAELGSLLGLTAPAAAERVKKLEEKGIIKGYAALVDPEAVDLGVSALISITLDKPVHRMEFLDLVRNLKNVQECYHVVGDADYILKIRCKNIAGLEVLISERIKGLPGVVKTRTTIILSTVKETTQLPLAEE